jgi:hypothetical protein
VNGKSPNWISAFLASKTGRANFLFLVLFLNVGFVRSPFARWTHGKVTSIARGQLTLWIKDESSGTTNSFVWDKDTLVWMEPMRRHQSGAAFDPDQLEIGSEVRVMFKKISGGSNRLERIIRLSPPAEHPNTSA